ncbi:MAG: phosphoribosylanthranilate isomerase [Flavobacteriaceae bacterium]|nr:phosphoribosylanthranilate isomerase [Flavobacteriaceae bacterium]NNM10098.1 phosphoribosylanthranilate isomerase [Flavobacteriaceae bacterium]
MKYNVAEVASLKPDYLGFIFYENSPRNFTTEIPKIPEHIAKVGVFVNAPISFIINCAQSHQLQVVQLHGDENPEFCKTLRRTQNNISTQPLEIWKVFHILDSFDFNQLQPFERYIDAFLFDTKGTLRGGTGVTFDWEVLKDYKSRKPFVLSGGIGLEEVDRLKEIQATGVDIKAIDVNSRFETKPGMKDIEKLKYFIDELQR